MCFLKDEQRLSFDVVVGQNFYRWNPLVGIERKTVWEGVEDKDTEVEWNRLNCCRDCEFKLEHIMATQEK